MADIADWSTNAALNVLSSGTAGTGGINTDEGVFPGLVNNAMRDMMARIKAWQATAVFTTFTTVDNTIIRADGITGKPQASGVVIDDSNNVSGVGTLSQTIAAFAIMQSLTSTDAGANGVFAEWYHNSPTAANGDILTNQTFPGNSSTGVKRTYGQWYWQIADATNGSEDSSFFLFNYVAGVQTQQMSITATGMQFPAIGATTAGTGRFTTLDTTGAFTSLGIDDNATAERLQIADTIMDFGSATAASDYILRRPIGDGTLTIHGGTSTGGRIRLNGASHASAGDVTITSDVSTGSYLFQSTNAKHNFTGSAYCSVSGATSNAFRFTQDTTDGPGSGNNTVGSSITNSGQIYSSSAGASFIMNRTADGQIFSANSGGTSQGGGSVSGATFSIVAFMGSHWSQLADGSKPEILRGTICETIDEMCAWPNETPEERLPRFKISDTPGSKSVYGVFAWWEIWDGVDEDGNPTDPPTNDAYIGSLGAYVIRIAAGVTAARGDLIESNGDGCGRVQADDILRSSTVAKVTASIIVETYPDGSYLVPCTLHCG